MESQPDYEKLIAEWQKYDNLYIKKPQKAIEYFVK